MFLKHTHKKGGGGENADSNSMKQNYHWLPTSLNSKTLFVQKNLNVNKRKMNFKKRKYDAFIDTIYMTMTFNCLKKKRKKKLGIYM